MLAALLYLGAGLGLPFWVGLVIMIGATVLIVRDSVCLQHTHVHTHAHNTLEGHKHAHT